MIKVFFYLIFCCGLMPWDKGIKLLKLTKKQRKKLVELLPTQEQKEKFKEIFEAFPYCL